MYIECFRPIFVECISRQIKVKISPFRDHVRCKLIDTREVDGIFVETILIAITKKTTYYCRKPNSSGYTVNKTTAWLRVFGQLDVKELNLNRLPSFSLNGAR